MSTAFQVLGDIEVGRLWCLQCISSRLVKGDKEVKMECCESTVPHRRDKEGITEVTFNVGFEE